MTTRLDRYAVALVLSEIGLLLELNGENPFKARAYAAAARALESLEGELDELIASGALPGVAGLGPATIATIEEVARTGASSLHAELRERTPPGLIELLAVPGLGAKRVHLLHAKLGIESVDDLERAIAENRVAGLSGFGGKTQEKLKQGLEFRRSVAGRRRRPSAGEAAERVVGWLRAQASVTRAEAAGSWRRGLETVAGVDVVAAVPEAAPVTEGVAEGHAVTEATAELVAGFLALPGTVRSERAGESGARAWLSDGFEVRLRCVAPEAFAAALVHATGGPEHVAALARRAGERGLRFDETGVWRGTQRLAADDEAAVYGVVGLPYIEPELREGDGEIEAAAAGALPALLRLEDLRGCFHCHTRYSDGAASVAEMAEAARSRGWRYLGLADHSQAAAYAGGLTPERIARQHEEIDAWNAGRGAELWLFKGIEADILPDGTLDYADRGDEVLGTFDYVVGSIHSGFGGGAGDMTGRVLRALENPHLTFLGHATGRLLLSRAGYGLDLDAVIEAAAERGIGIEINANPRRLELDWRYWRRARELGVRAAINPDAHSEAELDYVDYGVTVARKGWLGKDNVVNAWDLEAVRAWFAGRNRS